MKRRLLALFLLTALLLCACVNPAKNLQEVASAAKDLLPETTAATEEATTAPTQKPTEETAEETRKGLSEEEKNLYCGKWAFIGFWMQNRVALFEDLEQIGLEMDSDMKDFLKIRLEFNTNGKGYYVKGQETESFDWEVTANGISASGTDLLSKDGLLIITIDDAEMALEKVYDKDGHAVASSISASEPSEEEKAICGMWEAVKIVANGREYTVEQYIQNGASENLRTLQLYFFKTGVAAASTGDEKGLDIWTRNGDTVTFGSTNASLKSGLLSVPQTGGGEVYLKKVADWEWKPIETKAQTTSTGLRQDFKDAMDAYEEFYNEYIELLKEYTKNPTNLSILSKYMSMLSKIEEVDAAFEKWNSEDLNNEELKYYLDVSARIAKKLLEVM